MENISIKKLPKNEVEILLTIPWEEIKKTYDGVVEKTAKITQVKGFRQGKAPKKMVEESLDKQKLYSDVLQQIIPKYYQNAISQNNLNPITSPKISLVSSQEGKDWEIKVLLGEKPKIELGDYKNELSKINKTASIWVPGKDEKETEEEKKKKTDEKVQNVIKWLLENIKADVPETLLEEEVYRRLTELIDQTQKLGMTIEQYLASSGKSADVLKAEYRKQAEEIWQIEFILGEITEEEKIQVEDKDINEVIQKAKTEEERNSLESQKYFLASLLRRQKTLDFLTNL